MSGKAYQGDVRLTKAYCEGYSAGIAGVPKVAPNLREDVVAIAAWEQGHDDGVAGHCAATAAYAGAAECMPDYVPPFPPALSLDNATLALEVLGTDTVTVSVLQGAVPVVGVQTSAVSEDTDIATVAADTDGITGVTGAAVYTVTAVADGVVDLTFSYGGLSAVCAVTVSTP